MTSRRAAVAWLLAVLSGCVPHVIWVGRDPGRHLRAEIVSLGSEQWLRIGQTQSEHFDAVGTDGIVFAPDGSAVAWPARRAGKWFVVASGKTFGPFESVADLRFSPDSARLCFVAQAADGFHAVVDGALSAAYEHIQPDTLQFSRNSAHAGFVGSNGTCAAIVVDGAVSECRERVFALRVSDAGAAAAVIRDGGKERFVLAQQSGPPFDQISQIALSESGRYGYFARAGDRWSLVLDGTPAAECSQLRQLRFGDSGRRTAWVCSNNGQARVVVDGVAGPDFLSVSAPVLASRAPDFAYLAQDFRGTWVVSGEATLGPYSAAGNLVVAGSGGSLAFIARSAGHNRIVHRTHETVIDAVIEGSLVISDDGEHWAAITGESATQKLWITIDGARVRQLVASEVFGDPNAQFGPWLARELQQARTGAP